MIEQPSSKEHYQTASQRDLIELVLEPLASQVDQTRLQILERLKSIDDAVEIVARQVARQIQRRN